MDVGVVETWLRKRLGRDANFSLALAPLAILGGLLVLFLTFWFSYAVVWMVGQVLSAIPALLFDVHWKLRHVGRMWITSGFMILLVVSYLRSDRWRMHDFDEFADDPSALGETLARFGAGAGRSAMLLLYPQATARMVVELLSFGPQLLFAGAALLRESGKLRGTDTHAGARVLWTLLTQSGKVDYDELAGIYPATELTQAFRTLRFVPGVVFLQQGVTLTAELRTELSGFAKGG